MAELIKTTFQLRRGTAEAWQRNNPILSHGEPGFVIDENRLKMGDGTTAWNDLDYIGENIVVSDAPFQQLVTDADGKSVWEERLAYSNELPSVTANLATSVVTWYKVSEDVPSFVPAVEEVICVYLHMGLQDEPAQEGPINTQVAYSANDAWTDTEGSVVVVSGDSFDVGAVFGLEVEIILTHGTWYLRQERTLGNQQFTIWLTGVAKTTEAEKEIPWDGSPGVLKTIDPKYLPGTLATKSDIEAAIGNAIGGSY